MNSAIPNTTSELYTRRDFLRVMPFAGLAAAAAVGSAGGQAPSPFKAAVIGHTGRGEYGHGLENIFTGRDGIELVALADPDDRGRTATAQKVGAARSYSDFRALLARERPQLISIAMRHADQHHAVALEALRAGAHIYCEKPFTTTPQEADELLAEARRRNLKIAVAHTMRMTPPVVRLRQALNDGVLGQLVQVRAFGKQDTRAGGEDMMVLGSHLFDLMRLFLGDPLWCTAQVLVGGRDIKASDGRLVKDNVGLVAGDQITAQFAFPKGVKATFTSVAALRETVGHWGMELMGSKGVARLNCDIMPHVFLLRSNGWSTQGKTESWAPLDATVESGRHDHNAVLVDDWLRSIGSDRDPECSGANGAWAVEMVMAVYHAALTQRRVGFPLASRTHPLTKGGE